VGEIPVIHASRRFKKSVDAMAGPLQTLVQNEVRVLDRRMRELPDWPSQYERVAGVTDKILEIDIGGANRMLALMDEGRIILLDAGNHSTVKKYSRRQYATKLANDRASANPVGPAYRDGFVDVLIPEMNARGFEDEYAADWLHKLDKQQLAVAQDIERRLENSLLTDFDAGQYLVLGGPGTGKTSVLLWLLRRLTVGFDPASSETWNVGLRVSDGLAEFIEVQSGWDLSIVRAAAEQETSPDVVLIDDPADLESAGDEFECPVVAVFDPMQLEVSITDSGLDAWCAANAAVQYRLTHGYRQRRVCGEFGAGISNQIAASSPYKHPPKQARYRDERNAVHRIAQDMEFVRDGGDVRIVEGGIDGVCAHVSGLVRGRRQHGAWPSIAVVGGERMPGLQKAVSKITPDVAWILERTAVAQMKGLEYQHVILITDAETLSDLVLGFSAVGRARYDRMRLQRIPFTRARETIGLVEI
jgi:hypothetical protein